MNGQVAQPPAVLEVRGEVIIQGEDFAAFQAGQSRFHIGLGGEQNDGNMAGSVILLQRRTYFKTIFDRHHHVTDNQIGDRLPGFLYTLFAICRSFYLIMGSQTIGNVMQHILIVFDDQYFGGIF